LGAKAYRQLLFSASPRPGHEVGVREAVLAVSVYKQSEGVGCGEWHGEVLPERMSYKKKSLSEFTRPGGFWLRLARRF